jgi:hypothetical protein
MVPEVPVFASLKTAAVVAYDDIPENVLLTTSILDDPPI